MIAEVAQVVDRAGGGLVDEIHLGCGTLSGFEPSCLVSAFEQLRGGAHSATARLVIHPVALTAICDECEAEFEPAEFACICPGCGSLQTRIVRGDGLILEAIVLANTVEVRSP
jgi:Zn finger protein HypA/HybF involved in hydrogenase expression